jgi:UDP-glucose 4-epimerase
MRVALFGGSGFLGRAVARELAARGHAVITPPRVELTDPAALDALDVDADVMVNLAARVPTAPDTLAEHAPMMAVNATGAAHAAQWAIRRGIRRVVHGSTLVVVARPWPAPLTEEAPTYPTGPVTGYAASKLAGELLVGAIAAAGCATCAVLRFSALYGPGMAWTGVLPAFVDAALAGGRLRAVRGAHGDFLHVDDAARAVVAAAETGPSGVINVAAGVETSIATLATTVLAACGRSPDDADLADSPLARAQVDVARMHQLLGGARVSLADGVAGVVAARREAR